LRRCATQEASNSEHSAAAERRMIGCDEFNWDLHHAVGGGVCCPAGSQDAAASAAVGGICVAENVSGLRVDYPAVEGGLSGMREAVYTFRVWTLTALADDTK